MAGRAAVAVVSLGMASAAAAKVSKWSSGRGEPSYEHWLRSHKKASEKQIEAELGGRAHGCVFGAK